MSKRSIANFFLLFVSTYILILLLSSCSFLRAPGERLSLINQKDTEKFFGYIRPNPGDAESYYLFGCYLQEKKKHKLAVQEFMKTVKTDPTHIKAYNGMGVSYDLLGKHELAIESYKSALRIRQDLDYVLNNLGYSYFLQGDLEPAIESFKKAIAINNRKERYHNNLGLAYTEKGKYDQAFEEFKLAGDDDKASHNMARIYYRNGLLPDTDHSVDKIDEIIPSSNNMKLTAKETDQLAEILGIQVKMAEKETVLKEGIIKEKEADKDDTPAIQAMYSDPRYQIKEERNKPKIVMETDTTDFIIGSDSYRSVIEVSNGNGVNQMARMVGEYLNSRGFKFMYLMNADHFNHPETIIYYRKGYLQDAREVAQKLPGWQKMEETSSLEWESAEIKVQIGKDLVPFKTLFQEG